MIVNKSYNLYWEYSKKYYKSIKQNKLTNCRNKPGLFEIQWIHPKEISEFTRRAVPFWRRKWIDHGQVICGEWDTRDEHSFDQNYNKDWYLTQRPTIKYKDAVFHQSMVDRYVEELPWEATEQFKISRQRIKSGEPTWDGCESISDLLDKAKSVDNLFSKVETHGYKTQNSLKKKFKSAVKNEITVDMGRDGSYLFVDGRHRLSIAKILGLDRIPVQVCTVHQATQHSSIAHL